MAEVSRAILLVLVLMGLVSGCAAETENRPAAVRSTALMPGVPVRVTPAPQGSSTECPVGESRNPNGSCAPCPDYEGCFKRSADMRFFLDKIIGLMDGYSKATYQDLPGPAGWYFIPIGVTGEMKCIERPGVTARYSELSYEYCPTDKNIYIGEVRMWKFYSDQGDAGAAIGIAHEWGHHVQQVVGVKSPAGASAEVKRLHTIRSENQADCIAGAWFGYEVKRGVANDDDLKDADAVIAAIASAEGPTRNHGTLDERSRAFVQGYRDGIASCSSFFPEQPLITP